MQQAWLAGEFVPETEAKISIFDRGVVIGDGVFETVFAEKGIPEFFNFHFERLHSACQKLKIGLDLNEQQLRDVIGKLCHKNNLVKAAVRITLTRGLGKPGLDIDPFAPGNLIITARPTPPGTRELDTSGLRLDISKYTTHQANGLDHSIKSTNYLVNIMAKHEAVEAGYDDAIFLSDKGSIAETTTASIFFVREGVIYTPSLDSGILPGITRRVFLENIRKQGLQLEERIIMPNEISEMEEVFITSSLRGAKSVVQIQDFEYPLEGKWTQELRNGYFEAAKTDHMRHIQ